MVSSMTVTLPQNLSTLRADHGIKGHVQGGDLACVIEHEL